jgi:hypothetical protein
MAVRIAILGDYDPALHTHWPMLSSIEDAFWVSTRDVDEALLDGVDGLWLAPGSPYADFARVIAAIRYARQRRLPFLGTCGGFQHTLIEFARHVVGWPDADSVEHGATAHPVIVPAGCRLEGAHSVTIRPGTRLAAICGAGEVEETFFCGYQADSRLEQAFEAAGLRINAHATGDGAPRGCELAEHPFFLATAFQPQMRPGHRLIAAFHAAARHHALRREWQNAVTPADYEQHMNNTGQAAANAALSAELLAGVHGRKLWIAGAGPGQMFEHGLTLDGFDTTFTDVNAAFLERLRERLPGARAVVDDIEATRLPAGFDAALLVLVLEHVDWRKAIASLALAAREWLNIIQRNPSGMNTAVTPGVTPPGTMAAFATSSRPHLIDEDALAAQAAEYGYHVTRRLERPVKDGKAMIGLHLAPG